MEGEGSHEDVEMEVEQEREPSSSSLSSSSAAMKRFGLKNSIQTNFGDDYVFQIVAREDWTSMAVSLSSNAVKLYSPLTGQYLGECRGHSATVNHISFNVPSSPHILCSSSSDATIRFWDTRTFHQVVFWDWRTMKKAACLEESHMEDVTQVHFVPGHQNKLLSASVDGLMCLFDTSGDINEDDHLESVLNVGTSIGKVGFCGDSNQKIWCLTHIETLSVWDWKESIMEVNFEDARSLTSDRWTLGHVCIGLRCTSLCKYGQPTWILAWGRITYLLVEMTVDYFVDCYYSMDENRLWVIGGTNSGTLGYFPLYCKSSQGGASTIGSAEAVLLGGHAGTVRSILPMSRLSGRITQSQGIFGWTGGEDGRLCCWLSDEAFDSNRSFISSALVAKVQKNSRKSRHSPY
ncbi:WD repeat-containing protein GTS1-like isoform X2 [Coffea arabica]|uniref:WD repeat-containing protein GTS1-like isoform X2 n=1 Tax=Coffea arabica TaxID=13443 RepID=A0ABM4VUQ9_COFAR